MLAGRRGAGAQTKYKKRMVAEKNLSHHSFINTEKERFELSEAFTSSDFKSDAIDHSATSPDRKSILAQQIWLFIANLPFSIYPNQTSSNCPIAPQSHHRKIP
jgi:hypothetical protein